ncbi:hypothetical protein [Sagittula sp. S175]|uniref:hypothetical protein n=1 Tax=Sagittula sp. S175 TaxID=3415129 RepID=UPI003C7D0EC7
MTLKRFASRGAAVAAFSILARVTILAIGFVNVLLAARLYGSVATGQIGLTSAMVNLGALLALGGTEMMALNRLSGQDDARPAIFTASLIRIGLGGVMVSLLWAAAVVSGLAEPYHAGLGEVLYAGLPLLIALGALRVFCLEVIRASQSIHLYNVVAVTAAMMPLVFLLAWPLLPGDLSFAWVVALSEAVNVTLIASVVWWHGFGLRIVRLSRADLRATLSELRPFYVSSVSVAVYQLDILLMGFFADPAVLGVYVLASRLANVISLPKNAAGISFAPRVAQLFRNQGQEPAFAYTKRISLFYMPLSLVVFVLLWAGGGLVLGFINPAFVAGKPVLVLLCLAHLVLVLTGYSGQFLLLTGQEKLQQGVFVAASAVMILGIVVLVPVMGTEGGALAVLAGALVRGGVSTYVVRRTFGDGVSVWAVASMLLARRQA